MRRDATFVVSGHPATFRSRSEVVADFKYLEDSIDTEHINRMCLEP